MSRHRSASVASQASATSIATRPSTRSASSTSSLHSSFTDLPTIDLSDDDEAHEGVPDDVEELEDSDEGPPTKQPTASATSANKTGSKRHFFEVEDSDEEEYVVMKSEKRARIANKGKRQYKATGNPTNSSNTGKTAITRLTRVDETVFLNEIPHHYPPNIDSNKKQAFIIENPTNFPADPPEHVSSKKLIGSMLKDFVSG